MDIQFKQLEHTCIVGYPGLTHISKVQEIIPLLWNKMNETVREIPNLTSPPQCIGFEYYPFDFEKTGMFYYMPAYLVSDLQNVPKNMCGKTIQAGLHAVFTHKGPANKIAQSFQYIYKEWLPSNKEYVLSSNYDFEYYDNRFMGMDENTELEIWLPVKPMTD